MASDLGRPRIEALVAMAKIDVEAHRILQRRLGDPMIYDPSVRPLVVLVAEALARTHESRARKGGTARSGWLRAPVFLRRPHQGCAPRQVTARPRCPHLAERVRQARRRRALESVMLGERHPGCSTRRCRLLAPLPEGPVARS